MSERSAKNEAHVGNGVHYEANSVSSRSDALKLISVTVLINGMTNGACEINEMI
jgi:hypothetical protein